MSFELYVKILIAIGLVGFVVAFLIEYTSKENSWYATATTILTLGLMGLWIYFGSPYIGSS